MRYLVCGAGGFIGGHLASYLMSKGHEVVCADIKPLEFWFQIFDKNQNYSLDLKEKDNCLKVTKNIDYIFNMACNMGGMGFIENNKAECMLSVLINTNLLRASIENKVKKYFFSSSACVYNGSKQAEVFIKGLKEIDAYPADPEDGYGWEKLFSERMCRHFREDFGLDTKIVRYHNVFGPQGTFDGGREKAPAALCRKIINAKLNNKKDIEVWGDGNQTRSFLYIDDCIDGTMQVFENSSSDVFNVGSEEQVSINQMIEVIENIADYKVNKIYLRDKPLGVRGRSSDNSFIQKKIGWSPKLNLSQGLEKTYAWIFNQITNPINTEKFTRSY
ncbi:NAD-dependent epimerase/dehydratase family protein [Candidatus Pelagibacter sp.]|uniref:NAD-dependent epimerase/dehydratase family protein n=1 Tax=Candidatus Pelagibacter sp. TaxID=2024849 RepID=UPI003D109D2E